MRMIRLLAGGLAVFALACASGGAATRSADAEVKEGVRVARLGYWQEALFRFTKARDLDPANESALNDLAVAHEALGHYEEALAAYKLALQKAPKNSAIRKNYSRFAEFYTSYARGARPKGDEGATR